ncbi:unnamed protein product [Gongylonema pulchrum]|uniref:Hydroxysteroid 17-beta dehydrogenase 12 n=1 Tax=Gongylonema pulchrum TaxID=637853 RepID=A0A183E4S3_9BILA|nr:unnamed protein product [Gongylonema pulchrum]
MCFIITSLGYICLSYILFWLCSILYAIFYPYFIGRPIDLKKAAGGKWAVITGATDGIGKGYAFELARKGFSIVLISRSEIKLQNVKEQLIRETNIHDTEVITILFDFVCQDIEQYERIILSQLRNLDIGILGLLIASICINVSVIEA